MHGSRDMRPPMESSCARREINPSYFITLIDTAFVTLKRWFVSILTKNADNATPLPPSVEAAYYRKCIALKRRLNEIEANNEAARLRKVRLDRAILKMRLERAFLLERLAERMAPNVDDSDRSTSPPPTVRHQLSPSLGSSVKPDIRCSQPQEKPTRSKRTGRQKTPPLEGHQSGSVPPHHSPGSVSNTTQQPHIHPLHAMSSAQSTPDPVRPGSAIPYGNTSVPTGLNGTPSSTPYSGSAQPPAVPAPGSAAPTLPLPQPEFGEGRPEDRERPLSAANSTSAASGDYGRPFAAASASGTQGTTGEMLNAGPEIRSDANGERRIVQQDTEMGEADAAPRDSEDARAQAGGLGFTAVNR
ncbi:hypothetical protein SLS55_002416 [Diplodia seriata]|uniref:INO80 complex subunit F domain-containing protein n=2 Tax=Diplodia seriata TaxID=420778 RepID=A0ABR3CUQ7_9PEZI